MGQPSFQRVPITLELTTISATQPKVSQVEKYAAQLYEDGQRQIIKYDQELEEEGIIHNTLKISVEEVKVIRHGAIEMNQAYRLGETTTGTYQTRYGVFSMETKTTSCRIDRQSNGGRVTLEYCLGMNGQHVDQLTLRIDYRVAT